MGSPESVADSWTISISKVFSHCESHVSQNSFLTTSLSETHMNIQNPGWTVCIAVLSLFFLEFAYPIQAEEKEQKLSTAKNAKDNAEMILIPGGSFLMGSTTKEVDAQFRDTGLPEDWKTVPDNPPAKGDTLSPMTVGLITGTTGELPPKPLSKPVRTLTARTPAATVIGSANSKEMSNVSPAPIVTIVSDSKSMRS